VGGDKSGANKIFIRRCLDKGVSYAAINYRFRGDAPIQTILRDCARAIQFLRYKAKEFNLDKKRIASMGGSAGAGTSLWLAFHDDLADPRSPDPVLRESTRLTAAASISGQATYDILKWKDILGEAAAPYAREAAYPQLYGFKTPEELHTPAAKKVRADVDMLGLITKDDPPVYLIASSRFDGLRSLGDVQHSSRHSAAVKKRCDEVGVPAVLRIVTGQPSTETGDDSPIGFLLRRLLKKR
jgi:acetyl esterase/lipase